MFCGPLCVKVQAEITSKPLSSFWGPLLFLSTVGEVVPEAISTIERVNFQEVAAILKTFGFDFASKPYFKTIEDLQLFANIHKHGTGDSFRKLLGRRPDLFAKRDFGPPVSEDLEVTSDQLCEFYQALKSFWNDLELTL
ncbi:hypothetical protein ES708_09095 [subsurface metagenome]